MTDDAAGQNPDCWCFAWFAAPLADTDQEKAGLLLSSKWQPGAVIRIAFLDGTDEQMALVKRFATEWITDLARLSFSWVNDPAHSEVRITFAQPGSWSVIGTTCKNIARDRATMNFGWLTPGVTDEEARRVIVHEFGHALGLVHEHQLLDPAGWNKPAVIDDLSKPPNNWDAATIQHNMFDTYPPNRIERTTLDTTSIMMYPVPASWRTDGQSSGFNTDLSATDRAFIKKVYP